MFVANTVIASLGMILLPLVVGFFVAKKFKFSFKNFWKLFTAGSLTFIASQLLHIPFLFGLTALFKSGVIPSPDKSIIVIFNAILLGLLAGIFEESARYVLFKWVRKSSDTWQNGIAIGIGHGGIEAILLGVVAIASLTQMIAMRDMKDPSSLGIPANQVAAVEKQVVAYWSQPDVMPLFGFMERISAISLHVGLSILVLLSVLTNQKKWFWLALFWHAIVDALAAYMFPKILAGTHVVSGVFGFELSILVLSAGLLIYAIRSRSSFPIKNEV